MAEKEVSELDRKILLKKTYLDKVNYYLSRSIIDDQELFTLVRKFFSEFLKLDYEFTYEELSIELNKVFIRPKVKEQIDTFLLQLSESEYLEDVTLELDEIKQYLTELKGIIEEVILEDESTKHTETIIDKVLHLKNAPEKITTPSTVLSLIDETNFYLSSANIEKAKKSYAEALHSYETLSKNERKNLTDKLKRLYDDLQTLIKNPQAKIAESLQTKTDSVQSTDSTAKLSKEVSAVTSLIDETSFYISSGNVASAKKSYVSTLKAYESLNSDKKSVLHDKVDDLYKSLQELISSPKKAVKKTETPLPETKIKAQINDSFIEKKSSAPVNVSSLETNSYSQPQKNKAVDIDPTRMSSSDDIDTSKIETSDITTETKETAAAADNVILTFGSKTSIQENADKIRDTISPKNTATSDTRVPESSKIIEKSTISEDKAKITADDDSELIKNLDMFLDNATQAIQANILEEAQKNYSNALKIYTSMDNKLKKQRYQKIQSVFKTLEDIRHQESLHTLLDTHLTSKPQESQRVIEKVRENARLKMQTDNENVSSDKSLVVADSNQNSVRINELIEESYFNIDNRNVDVAMLKYFKALDIYHRLQNTEKKRSYWNIYLLYKKLSSLKSSRILAQDYLS